MATLITNSAEYFSGVTTETGDIKGVREDLSDVIYNISPTETPFMSNIGRTKATSTNHEWQTDVLQSAAANAHAQGEDYSQGNITFDAVNATTRIGNYTQISSKTVIVAGTTEAILKAGRKSELAYHVAKKGKELKRDMEFVLTGDTPVGYGIATSGTGATLKSMETWITSNAGHASDGSTPAVSAPTTNVTDGTQRNITEDLVRAQIQATWSAGGDPDCILAGPVNKQNISSQFAGIATLYKDVNTGPATIIGASDVYVHDFGELKIVPSRFNRDRTVSILQKDMWAIAYLRPFKIKKLSDTGDAEKRLMLVEYTLECRNEAASAKVADLNTALL
ncbi:MAG: DUF5309 domain-containing protein [Candidatus Brocadiales bacterium]|nr:DUF5309 domain-containing protein [Candidatus Brocadiales bacterium]